MKRCLSLTLAALPGFVSSLKGEAVVDGASYGDLFNPPDAAVAVVHPTAPEGAVAQLLLSGAGSGPLGLHWNATVNGGAKIATNLVGADEIVLAASGAQARLTGSALEFNMVSEGLLSLLGTGLTLNWNATATFDKEGAVVNLAPNSVYDVSFDVVDGSGLLNSTLGITPTFGIELLDGADTAAGSSSGNTLVNIIGLDLVEVVGGPQGTGRATVRFRTGATVGSGAAKVRFTGSAVLPVDLLGIGSNFATISNLLVDAVDPYTVWLEDNEVPESMQDPAADPDNDGKPNSQEYALATDPNSGGHDDVDFAIGDPDGAGPDTSAFVMTLPVRSGAQFANEGGDQVASQDGASYRVEGSFELMNWSLAVSEVTANQSFVSPLPPLPAGWEYRSFRVPGQTPDSVRAFLRVKFD